jgi:pyruvate,water dikinase
MEFIIPFSKISEDKKSIVGGKSYSLGVLIQNGINVPDGFAVTTGAYHAFRLEGISQGEAFSQRALEAFDRLNVEKVAVRSSAVAEDSENESWAGQLESFLNVDRDHLLEAIQLCWKSGDSDRIRAYMKDKEISEDKRAVGVAVQAMIPSEVAGGDVYF